jgi:alcohol dehydrogenase YqhD (iron-dependent ADH family)
MENFIYSISTRAYFGRDTLQHLEHEIPRLASRILLVYGGGSIKKIGMYEEITAILKTHDIVFEELGGVQPNPRLQLVKEGIQLCREKKLTFILAVGGGSVIDCAKAIAAGVPYNGDPWDFFTGKAQVQHPLPIGTVLTIAATGSEMNGNAVITNTETTQKLAVRSDLLRPQFSILDPSLTFTVPREQTAAGVVDIYSHVLEQYFSPTPDTYVQDRISESLLHTVIKYGPIALREPTNYNARAQLMWTSSLALNGLLTYGKITDWATHAIEHKVSAVTDLTHGIGLAILTPAWMEYVSSDDPTGRLVDYANHIWGIEGRKREAVVKKGIEKTRAFFASLGMPSRLKEVGVKENQLQDMARSIVSSGEIGKFRRLNETDVYTILKNAY